MYSERGLRLLILRTVVCIVFFRNLKLGTIRTDSVIAFLKGIDQAVVFCCVTVKRMPDDALGISKQVICILDRTNADSIGI